MAKDTKNITVGLSGGVDSAVAALLLKQQGFNVSAIFMKNWDEDDGSAYCTAEQDFEDAKRVADSLDIALEPINFAVEYWDSVFEEFLIDYRCGRTPNPDVQCNRYIKFDVFLNYVRSLGSDWIATGHYARRKDVSDGLGLFRPRDKNKDQTYFLQAVPKANLKHCRFPLADLTKPIVRELAKKNSLHVHDRKDSTGICFIGERRFSDFLSRYVSDDPGTIVDEGGKPLGIHSGLPFYTLGQRRGLGVGGVTDRDEGPWYVVAKRQESNELVVSQDVSALMHAELIATDANWFVDEPSRITSCSGMIRYHAPLAPCNLSHEDDVLIVSFKQPQRAITPGQYVAFYDGDRCLGGARIESAP